MLKRQRSWSIPRTRGWGVGLAATTAVISGIAVFVNAYGVRSWTGEGASTATYTTFKNLVAAVLLVGLMSAASARRSPKGIRLPARRSQWMALAAIGLIGGSVPFVLFFEGLARATSTQAAFIHKTLILWVAVMAIPLLKERLGAAHFAAIGLLLAGQASLGGGFSGLTFGPGEIMILAATLLWSIEVVVAKRLLDEVSGLTVGVARMGLGVAVLVAYGLASGGFAGVAALGPAQWGWIALTGIILSAYVATWYTALARAQAVDVTGVLVLGALVTAVLRRGFEGAATAPAGLVLVAAGVLLLIWSALRAPSRSPAGA